MEDELLDELGHYLHLVPNTPLQFLYERFFPQGFPALALPNGLPDFYERSCGTLFWKLDLERMSELQKAALRDWYYYTVRLHRVDYKVDSPASVQSDWSDLIPYRDIVEQTGLQSVFTSYRTVEPPNLAIALCEGAPALAQYCVPQEYWQNLVTELLSTQLNRLKLQQRRALQERQFCQLPAQPQPPLPPAGQPNYDHTSTGFW